MVFTIWIHNSAPSTPQTLISASFERWDSHESNDQKISSGVVDHAELRMILGRAFFPKMLIFDQFGFENGWFWDVGWPRTLARGGPFRPKTSAKNVIFGSCFWKMSAKWPSQALGVVSINSEKISALTYIVFHLKEFQQVEWKKCLPFWRSIFT